MKRIYTSLSKGASLRRNLLAAGAAAAALLLAGCGTGTQTGQSGSADSDLVVATSAYPMTVVASAVVGDAGTVLDLAPPGGEAHDLELSPRQVVQLEDAQLALYLGSGFQPAVELAVQNSPGEGMDALQAVPSKKLRDGDPHVWLSPLIMADLGDELADRLAQLDEESAGQFERNAKEFRLRLEQLDAEYSAGLAECEGTLFLSSHEAFGYLADAYGLQQVGVLGTNPESEPSPKRLQQVEELAKENDVTVLFVESTDSSGEKLAQSVGLTPVPLLTLEVAPTEGDYFQAMRENLQNLRAGLGCGA